jgi:transcriptional/translational regulatory protein YebC/TACO1
MSDEHFAIEGDGTVWKFRSEGNRNRFVLEKRACGKKCSASLKPGSVKDKYADWGVFIAKKDPARFDRLARRVKGLDH